MTHVPARDWPPGARRPVYAIRADYPRYVIANEDEKQQGVQSEVNNVYGPDYTASATYPDRSIYDWNHSIPIGFIDQVPHTYAYTLGTYGIQNERQLSMGESTCGAIFMSKSPSEGGSALFKLETLTEIAMERCASARCAVLLMGQLATQYGFFGTEYSQDESGEALVVSDKYESWYVSLSFSVYCHTTTSSLFPTTCLCVFQPLDVYVCVCVCL